MENKLHFLIKNSAILITVRIIYIKEASCLFYAERRKIDNGKEIDLSMYKEDKDFINYEFEEKDDGSITLRRYNGNVDYLILPKEYNDKK